MIVTTKRIGPKNSLITDEFTEKQIISACEKRCKDTSRLIFYTAGAFNDMCNVVEAESGLIQLRDRKSPADIQQ